MHDGEPSFRAVGAAPREAADPPFAIDDRRRVDYLGGKARWPEEDGR